MYIQSYKELIVWQKSIDLVEEVYILTSKFPKEETYGLVSQERRAVVSIPSNIAEGQRRKDIPEFLYFLRIADASSAELETQLIISKRLYPDLDYSRADSLLEEVQKMLTVMMGKLELKANSSKLKAQEGFTIVELLVSMSLFIVIISIASGVFVQSMRTQRTTVALVAAVSNAQLTIEQMAREIRTGQGFSLAGGELDFINAKGEKVIYRLKSEAMERGINGVFRPLTAENVSVKNFRFILSGNSLTDNLPSKITIILQIGTKESQGEGALVNLQTSISARTLEG